MMSKRFNIIAVLLLSVGSHSIAIASSTKDTNASYFKAVEQIKKLPQGASAVLPCSIAEKKQVLQLLKQNRIETFGALTVSPQGQLANDMGEDIDLYKGNFDNTATTSYAFVARGGSMRTQTVTMYKQTGNQLTNLNFNDVVTKNLIPGKEMSDFYMWVADPFAMVKDGKTYLRFMNYPVGDYDKKKLQLCTYLWQKNKITLTGPNAGSAHCIK